MTTRSNSNGIVRHSPDAHKAASVSAAGLLFISGTVADDPRADFAVQTCEVLAKLDALLEQAGATREDIVSATIWLADITARRKLNDAWNAWLAPGHPPARVCVGAALAEGGYLVEIALVARAPEVNP